jgi:hypothetical protein
MAGEVLAMGKFFPSYDFAPPGRAARTHSFASLRRATDTLLSWRRERIPNCLMLTWRFITTTTHRHSRSPRCVKRFASTKWPIPIDSPSSLALMPHPMSPNLSQCNVLHYVHCVANSDPHPFVTLVQSNPIQFPPALMSENQLATQSA